VLSELSMKRIAFLTTLLLSAACVLLAKPPVWTEQEVRDTIDQALGARLIDARVEGSVISLDLTAGAASPQAVRAIVAAITRLPGDAGRLILNIRTAGARVHPAPAKSSARAAREAGEPSTPLLFLHHDSDASSGIAQSIRAVLAEEGFEVITSADVDQGAAQPDASGMILSVQATPGAGRAVLYSSEPSRALAEAMQAAIPGALLIECEACLPVGDVPAIVLELGDSAAEAVSRMDAGLAVRDALRPFAAADRSASKAEMSSPAPGSTLSGASITFQWTAGADVTNYWLMAGTWLGGNTIYSSDQGTLTSATITGIPTDGRTIYVRLFSYINNQWVSNDYQYTAFSTGGPTAVKAAIILPAAGSTLPGTAATFQWNSGTGVARYYLFAGAWQGGNTFLSQDMGTNLSASVTGLPADGSTVYVRLWSYVNSAWEFNDYTFKAAGAVNAAKASMTSPAPGSTLPGSSATFQWNAGTGVSRYYLFVGRWVGGNTLFSQDMGTNLTAAVTGLPSDASTVYVRLWSSVSGTWQYNDYTYTAAGSAPAPVKGAITSPASGSTLAGASATFAWTSGSAVQRFWLFVGTTVGNNDIYGGDQGANTSATVGGLPTNGRYLYVRLWSYINGAWQYSDSQYKAAGQ